MRRVKAVAAVAVAIIGILPGLAMPASAQSVTAYEGARLIVGDGRVIETATLVVDGVKIVQAGAAADVRVPAGAARVSLAGKTVMPMLVDTHVHLSPTRDGIVRDLKLRAYYGGIGSTRSSHRRSTTRSSTRRTSEGSGSPRTSSSSRTRRG